jgi:hypothetical protein
MTDSTTSDMRAVTIEVSPHVVGGWHGRATVDGEVVNSIIGSTRAVVLDDCICAVAAAGVDVEVEP